MKITAYKILQKGSSQALEEAVNALIAEGWQPYGHMVTNHAYIQPMVQYDEDSSTITTGGLVP